MIWRIVLVLMGVSLASASIAAAVCPFVEFWPDQDFFVGVGVGNIDCGAVHLGEGWLLVAAHCFDHCDQLEWQGGHIWKCVKAAGAATAFVPTSSNEYQEVGIDYIIKISMRDDGGPDSLDEDVALANIRFEKFDSRTPHEDPAEDWHEAEVSFFGWEKRYTERARWHGDFSTSAGNTSCGYTCCSGPDSLCMWGLEPAGCTPTMRCPYPGASGGPLLLDGKVIGFLTTATRCQKDDRWSVFTLVDGYFDEIMAVMESRLFWESDGYRQQ